MRQHTCLRTRNPTLQILFLPAPRSLLPLVLTPSTSAKTMHKSLSMVGETTPSRGRAMSIGLTNGIPFHAKQATPARNATQGTPIKSTAPTTPGKSPTQKTPGKSPGNATPAKSPKLPRRQSGLLKRS
ncbi:hypothetical protein JVU11DRAFT_10292 [Chiua virens]|nr:hypothetical protein JVU11DRAFT_10292 [Chiua virens]